MSIVQKITIRSMKKNQSTSLVILFGIILSVALMTGLLLFSHSIYRFFRDDAIKRSGDSQIVIGDVSREKFNALPNKDMVEKTNQLSLIGVEKNERENDDHFIVVGITEDSMRMSVPLKVVEGRLPAKEGEAVINKSMNNALEKPINIGQSVVIDLHQPDHYVRPANDQTQIEVTGEVPVSSFKYTKDRDLPVTIVGVVENLSLGRVVRGNLYFVYQTPDQIEASNRLWAGFVLKDISTQRISTFVRGFGDLEYNTLKVTDYYPTVQSSMNTLMRAITYSLLVVIALAGIALIQNGFLVSLSRRIRDLSVLSSIGMTRRQKWIMSLTEGLVMYVIGMPLGVVAGFAAILGLLKVITPKMQNIQNTDVVMRLVWEPQTLVIIALAALVTLFIASIIPVIRTSQKTPLAGVRQQDEIKLKPRSLRSPKIISKLFGTEGEIAWKNQRRNRRRFRGTLIALIFSMVLFLSVSSLVQYMDLSSRRLALGKDDIYIGGIHLNDFRDFASYDALLETEGIKDGYAQYYVQKDIAYHSDHFSEGYEYYDNKINVALVSFDAKTLDKLMRELNITRDDLKGNCAVLINQFFHESGGRYLTQTIFDQIPSTIELKSSEQENGQSQTIEIAKSLNTGLEFSPSQGPFLQLVVLPETLALLANGSRGVSIDLNINAEKEQLKPLIKKLETRIQEKNLQGYVYNRQAEIQSTKDLISLASILIFGFLATIMLIVVANIYNTLSTSLRNRRREFAVLRSVGMDDTEFRRMIRVESFLYSIKVVLYGIPLAILTSYIIYRVVGTAVEFSFRIPYLTFALSSVVVMGVVILIMSLGSRKTRKGNILDALKMDAEV